MTLAAPASLMRTALRGSGARDSELVARTRAALKA
jgi:hypothetical protein